MIQLPEKKLSSETENFLADLQSEINQIGDFSVRSKQAKEMFESRTNNKAFKEIKDMLKQMSRGNETCNYCENSRGIAIEHIQPKDHYPEYCFVWDNYAWACTHCNSAKGNQYSIFRFDTETEFRLTRKAQTPPPNGQSLFIHPRRDNPLQILYLDFQEHSFNFLPLTDKGTITFLQALYTIRVLKLNDPVYTTGRKNAYLNYKGRLRDYLAETDTEKQTQMITSLQSEHHQTVWHEMKRQRNFIPELQELFSQLPEALTW